MGVPCLDANCQQPAAHNVPWRASCLPPPAGAKVVAVAAGMEHSLALAESGEVYSWGHAEHGRLGHGRAGAMPRLFGTSIEFKPRLIRAFEALRIAQVRPRCGGGWGGGVVGLAATGRKQPQRSRPRNDTVCAVHAP